MLSETQDPMPLISIWEFLIILTGFLSPKVIAFLQNPLWDSWKKVAVNIGFHALIALAYLGAAGNITEDVFQSGQKFIIILGQLVIYSSLSYAGLWKPRHVNAKSTIMGNKTLMKMGLVPKHKGKNQDDKNDSNSMTPEEALKMYGLNKTPKTHIPEEIEDVYNR